MSIEEYIECPNCQRAVIPRLWLTGGDYVTYMTTQHLCPFCGVVMYETGGGIKRVPLILTIVAIPLIVLALILFLS